MTVSVGAGSVDRPCRSRLTTLACVDRGQARATPNFRFRPLADVRRIASPAEAGIATIALVRAGHHSLVQALVLAVSGSSQIDFATAN